MTTEHRRFFVMVLLAIALVPFLMLAVINGLGLRWNRSSSVPTGLWRVSSEPIRRGTYVMLDEPIKEIAGMPGDRVTFTPGGVYINGRLWPDSAPKGPNHYPFSSIVLQSGEYLLMGRNPLSYDARYFGWTPATIISGMVQPVWTSSTR